MTDVANVVEAVLRKNGSNLLVDRDSFLKCVQDGLGVDTREAKLLAIGCDDTFLGLFSAAVEAASADSLARAAKSASEHLTAEYVLDPDVSGKVAEGIAAGCGSFLGIEVPSVAAAKSGNRNGVRERDAKRGVGATIVTSIVVFALMSALAAAVLSHYFPYLGCTVLPRKATVSGVECSWYTIKDGSGNPTQVVFLHNTQDEAKRVIAKPSYGNLQPRTLLRPDGDGLLVLAGDNGTDNFMVTTLGDEVSPIQFKLTWSYKTDENGDVLIEIQNDGDRGLERSDVVLAQHGTFVNLRLFRSKKTLDQGSTEHRFGSMYQLSNFGDSLVIDDDTELYVDGTKVPRS